MLKEHLKECNYNYLQEFKNQSIDKEKSWKDEYKVQTHDGSGGCC